MELLQCLCDCICRELRRRVASITFSGLMFGVSCLWRRRGDAYSHSADTACLQSLRCTCAASPLQAPTETRKRFRGRALADRMLVIQAIFMAMLAVTSVLTTAINSLTTGESKNPENGESLSPQQSFFS